MTQINDTTISIKIKLESGCFCREHCAPHMYHFIDTYITKTHPSGLVIKEHESGPEILVYLVVGVSIANLTTSIINLIAAILKARSEGVKLGDRAIAPLEIVFRKLNNRGKRKEERIIKFSLHDEVESNVIKNILKKYFNKVSIRKRISK